MSSEILLRAAALIRERASKATPGPWGAEVTTKMAITVYSTKTDEALYEDTFGSIPDAEYIASWHPAVALAVANMLEAEAEYDDECCLNASSERRRYALALAKTYLGIKE